MATSHYTKKVKEYLMESGIEFVPKSKNPPNVPQARGIERFWALCKSRYSQRYKEPKSIREFKKVWRNISYQVARESEKAVMKSSFKKLRNIAYNSIDLA